MLAALALAGCANTAVCGAGLHPASRIDLYFGLDVPGRKPVSPEEWRQFADAILTPAFPDGFTVVEATGVWRNPKTNAVTHEGARVVTAVNGIPTAAQKAAGAYRAQFHQDSVGITQTHVCAAF
jgi:hypothetical protein